MISLCLVISARWLFATISIANLNPNMLILQVADWDICVDDEILALFSVMTDGVHCNSRMKKTRARSTSIDNMCRCAINFIMYASPKKFALVKMRIFFFCNDCVNLKLKVAERKV